MLGLGSSYKVYSFINNINLNNDNDVIKKWLLGETLVTFGDMHEIALVQTLKSVQKVLTK